MSTLSPFTFAPSTKAISCEQHVISSLLLLNIVVLATYFYGVYLFVRGESEYLFVLASHVSVCVCVCVSMSLLMVALCVCVCSQLVFNYFLEQIKRSSGVCVRVSVCVCVRVSVCHCGHV